MKYGAPVMATYGYVRVSTAEQAAGTSLEEQERKIRGVALIRGGGLERVFCEPGASGSQPLERRPVGRELFDTLKPGDTLIVAKLDRAFRNAADALTKSDLWRSRGTNLVIADMGPEPVTGNGVAKMFFGMLALVAEFERERILERTTDGRRTKAARGGHVGGNPPFGFRVTGTGKTAQLIEIPEEQAAINTILASRNAMSLRRIAQLVEEKHCIRISHEAVRRTLLQHEPTPDPPPPIAAEAPAVEAGQGAHDCLREGGPVHHRPGRGVVSEPQGVVGPPNRCGCRVG